MILAIQALDRPVAEVDIDARRRFTIRNARAHGGDAALVVMELAAPDITYGEMRGIDRRQVATESLEDNKLEAVAVPRPISGDGVQVSRVIPPLREVIMRAFVLGKMDGRQRRLHNSLCRGQLFRGRDNTWKAT